MWHLWINSMAITAFIVVYGTIMKPAKYPLVPDKPFSVFWNAPTEPCKRRFKVDLELDTYYIVSNPNQTLSGSSVSIFYFNRLGNYPHIDKSNNLIFGGVPQNQDIIKHLTKVQTDIEKAIPMKMFNGIGVIVWEHWRPLWVRNWGNKAHYQNFSMDLVRRWHPNWSQASIQAMAKEEFENAARRFMNSTLLLLQQMRPYGLWGFYSYPECYNYDYKTQPATYTGECPRFEHERNDQLLWLWKQSTALFPSLFLVDVLKSSPNVVKFIRHRLIEAMRAAAQSGGDYDLPVFAYVKPIYTNSTDFLTEEDLVYTIGESAAMGTAGAIVWGSTSFGRTQAFCELLKNYVAGPLGRYVVNVTVAATMCSQQVCSNNGKCVRKVSKSNAYLHLPSPSFKIELRTTKLGKRIHLKGRLDRQEKAQWRKHFNCQCFPDWTGLFCEIPCSR